MSPRHPDNRPFRQVPATPESARPEPHPPSTPTNTPTSPGPQPAVNAVSSSSQTQASQGLSATDFELDLLKKIQGLTPEKREHLRGMARMEGISLGAHQANTDGSITVPIRIDGDLVPQLQTWADEAGHNLAAQVQEIVQYLLSGYLCGEWTQIEATVGGKPISQPAVAPAAAAAPPPAAAPAAATTT